MTEKRFTIKEFSTLDAMSSLDVICDNGIELPSSTACDLLNELSEENEKLKKDCSNLIDDNTEYVAEINQMHKENEQLQKKNDNLVHMIARVQYRADTIKDENEQLKSKNRGLQSELQIFKEDATHSNLLINKLADENDQLKISSTMYHNLFKEFQRQMQGVKSIYDLDSKDFEDLIELSKGNVFDDKIGWVHLPIEELQE